MSKRNRVTAIGVSAALASSMVFTGGSAAAATPSSVATSFGAVSTAPASGLNTSGSPVPAPLRLPGGSAAEAQPQAVPIAVRLAVRAAMETLKRTQRSWYNAIINQVSKGRTAFVNWWNNSVPDFIKGVFAGVSASAIYDALIWLLGLD